MTGFPWGELGIAPTADRASIRRAYAARLKALGPNRDPVAFQQLRGAYESALSDADQQPQPPAPPQRTGFDDEPEPDAEAERARTAVATALDRGDAAAAFAAFDAADQRGLLALADLDAIEERLLAAAADRTLSPAQLERIVQRFQWDNSVRPLRRKRVSFAALDARLDAERWYSELVERQFKRRGIFESDEQLAARQLLRPSPTWWERHVYPNRSPALSRELAAFSRHREWIEDRFDPERVAWCWGRPANRSAQRTAIAVWMGFALFALLVTAQGPARLIVFVFIVLTWLFIVLVRGRSARRR